MIRNAARFLGALLLLAAIGGAHAAEQFSANQADAASRPDPPGRAAYEQYCQTCHGSERQGGEAAPALAPHTLEAKWRGRSVKDLLDYVQASMPPGRAAALTDVEHRQVVTYLLQELGWFPKGQQIPVEPAAMRLIILPNTALQAATAAAEATASTPNHPLLQALTPVTDAMLIQPPQSDWLMWRRTYDSHGFSPLRKISHRNVSKLRAVWSWTMGAGRGLVTPLVHDGVVFVYGPGDRLYAFDAAHGDVLWRYDRQWVGKTARYSLRGISIYRDLVILPTDDGSVVALDMRTGRVRWDRQILDAARIRFSGGPLAADGVIMLGTSTGSSAYGRNFIVGLDATNGNELWRQYTVANPDEAGGDTWNNIPPEQRTGAGVWTPGAYDPASRLAFFGTGNNYFFAPLRQLSGAARNDALYTNSTLALDVRTGRLAWHFQHLPNDQWNYDWAFERTLLEAQVGGERRRVVMTAGKQGIFDAMRASDGAYQFSVDLGLQSVVSSIDPATGAKRIAPDAVLQEGVERLVCPSSHGVRNWMPTAFSASAGVLFVPFLESCMTVGDPASSVFAFAGFGQKGVPRPDSDGKLGGLRAFKVDTGETLWSVRRRAVPTSGVLTTAGNLVFAGFLDRTFAAFRADDGAELWSVRLNDIPSAAPIAFMVDGVQYIAVMTGHGSVYARNIDRLFMAPEIQTPEEPSATVWVFALPSK